MKSSSFYRKYNGKVIEDCGAYVSPEFRTFAKDLKSVIKDIANSINAQMVSFSVGHYFISAFVQKGEHYAYISYDLSRMKNLDLQRTDPCEGFLVRAAKGPEDSTGLQNTFTNVYNLDSYIESALRATCPVVSGTSA